MPADFFEHQKEIEERLRDQDVFIFLDYDGTLTPIVDTPDQAIISEAMRDTVRRLAEKYKVSIVSGRATDDVWGKAKIDGIFYAGSHGFEIVQPDGTVEINEEAQAVRATIDEAHAKLSGRLKDVEGALVEHVKYTISTHYRLVADKDFPKIEQAVEDTLKEYPNLRKTHGKKVFEIRPKIDWDKGKAVEWILRVLDFDGGEENAAVYIGDDTTDEDAFRVLRGKGFGILVADPPRDSEAEYVIPDTPAVQQVLERFIEIKS